MVHKSSVKKVETQYFYRSAYAVGLLNFVTLNTYSLYWFYKQWKEAGETTNTKTYPVLGAIFNTFTATSLFRRIATLQNPDKPSSWPIIGGLGFFIISIGTSLIVVSEPTSGYISYSTIIIGSALLSMIISLMQQFRNQFLIEEKHSERSRISVPEWIFIVFGIVVVIGNILLEVKHI